jgi:hypothetical protein
MATIANFKTTPHTYQFIQYDGTLEDFTTTLTTLFGGIAIYEDSLVPGRAIILQDASGVYQVLGVVDPGQWFGNNFGAWSVMDDSVMQGTGNGQGFTPIP